MAIYVPRTKKEFYQDMSKYSETRLNNYAATFKKTSKWKWLQPYDLLSIHDDLFSQTRKKLSSNRKLISFHFILV